MSKTVLDYDHMYTWLHQCTLNAKLTDSLSDSSRKLTDFPKAIKNAFVLFKLLRKS